MIFKKCAAFTVWISEINNKGIDNTKYIDVVMAMYNSLEYSDNYLNTVEVYGNETVSNFWRTLEMRLINWVVNLILTWSENVCYLMLQPQQHLQ